jgi:beta-lactamase class A
MPTLPTEALLAQLASQAELAEASIVVERLSAPVWTARLRAAAPLSPASMIKTPLAAAVLTILASGQLDPDRPIPVSERNITPNDAASPLDPGYAATPAELLELAIARSDNVATNELIDLAGRSRATALLHAMGLKATHIRSKLSGADPLIEDPERTGRNAHPAGDAALLFAAIANRSFPGAAELEGLLERQVWNDKLPLGWYPGDRFAHKTGDTSEVSHDGGILTTREGVRFALAVYTALPSGPLADGRIAAFAAALRPFLL